MCAVLTLSIAWPASAEDRFAYFLDHFSCANLSVAVPAGTVVIGVSTQAQRTTLVQDGRVVGCSTGLSSKGGSKVLWCDSGTSPDLHALFNAATPPDLLTCEMRRAFALQIFAAARVDPGAFPSLDLPRFSVHQIWGGPHHEDVLVAGVMSPRMRFRARRG